MRSSRDFEVSVESVGRGTIIHVRGEVDVQSVSRLVAAIDAAFTGATERVLIECDDMTFIDSVGLGALVRAARLAHERDLGVALTGLRPHVRKVLEITGLSNVLREES